MLSPIVIDLQWGMERKEKTPAQIAAKEAYAAREQAKLQKKREAYQNAQKRKLERMKERWKTDPEFRAKRKAYQQAYMARKKAERLLSVSGE